MTETNPSGSSIILNGDVIEQLQAFDDNTFDACLSDPPYLLEFMGKDFDRQHLAMEGENDGQKMYQWHLGWCRELYRVLKPGAFAMVFGGTRTSHRLACALEDVGFEIRDTIEWMQGQGFPKGHDIEKNIRRIVLEKAEHDLRFVRRTYLSAPVYACSECGQVLLKIVQKQSSSEQGEERTESETTRKEQSSLERWSHLETSERELFRCKVCTMSHGIFADGEEGRICDGTQTENGEEVRKTPEEIRSSSSQGSRSKQQPSEQFDAVSLERRAQTFRGYNPALKPAHEPIILCMKPFDGTFAENALEYGVAGLNIDGGRIKHSSNDDSRIGKGYQHRAKAGLEIGSNKDNAGGELQTLHNPSGRWPANLILSHTPYCQLKIEFVGENPMVPGFDCHPLCPVKLLDEQSGISLSSGTEVGGEAHPRGIYSSRNKQGRGQIGFHDKGGASRFFYCAKVSTRERNAGNIDCKHPTLKPIDLCRYLAILLLPPPREDDPRQIIVPFSGAGSEMAGALSAGWDMVIGIEMDREYIEWAKARIPDLSSGKLQSQSQPRKPKPKLLPDEDYNLDIFS